MYNVTMKKLSLVIIALTLLCGCASNQKFVTDYPSWDTRDRFKEIYGCMHLEEDGITPRLFIARVKGINAWIDNDNRVYLTPGLYNYDDNTLMFIMAHELSHAKLKHIRNRQNVSYATTGVMMVAGFIVPGVGLLNHAVNPAVTNNFSKFQEYDADRLAAETLVKCFDISVDQQIHIIESLKKDTNDAGGFWDRHPSWNDRIENIRGMQNINK